MQSPALAGNFTAAAALSALLAGSKLTYRVVNLKTIEIRPGSANAAAISNSPRHRERSAPIHSEPPAGSDPVEEVVVIASAEGLVATRTATPLSEIPQTVSIVSHEQIRQQNDTDLADVLSHAVGVTVSRTDSLHLEFFSRGFQITSFHVDGGGALYSLVDSTLPSEALLDLSEFDHIEVLRGADALFGGNGNPGATVSLVRKRPLDSTAVMFNSSAGSWSNYRVESDITGPLGFSGTLRGRLDGMYESRNYFYDRASLDRKKIFAVVEYDLTPATLLTAGGSYQWDDATPMTSGLPSFEDGTDPHFPRHMSLSFDWVRNRTRMRELYLKLRQEFNGSWRLQLDATAWNAATEYAYGYFPGYTNRATKSLLDPPYGVFSSRPNSHDRYAFDATLTGTLNLFGRREEVAVGGDFTRIRDEEVLGVVNRVGDALADVYAFDASVYPDPRLKQGFDQMFKQVSISNQGGLFASMRAYLNEALSAVAGARVSSSRISSTSTLSVEGFTNSDSASSRTSGVVTPYAGVIYDLNDHYSLYASYADIYLTVGENQRADGSLLGAANGVDIEGGVKGTWRHGALNASFVLYKIDQSGLPLYDATSPRSPGVSINCCFRAATSRSRGVDAELNGEVAPGWLLGAGYTLNVNHSQFGDELSKPTPRHLLKSWTSTRLPGSLQRWSVGGSVHAQSRNARNGTYCPEFDSFGSCAGEELPFQVVQEPYVVVDLRLGLHINAAWQAALSVNNVFDRIYYQSIALPQTNNWYGEPRGFVFRIDGRY